MAFYYRQKCMYHRNHDIVSFCKCKTCFLPVCQVCIRIHKNQHFMYQTQPQIQSIQKVYKQIQIELKSQVQKINTLKQIFIQFKPKLQKNQVNLIQELKMRRQKLIQQFQKFIISVEKDFILQIQKQKLEHLSCVENLQSTMTQIQRKISQDLIKIHQFSSQSKLQMSIDYFSNDQQSNFQRQYLIMQEEMQKYQKIQLNYKNLQILNEIENFIHEKTYELAGSIYQYSLSSSHNNKVNWKFQSS